MNLKPSTNHLHKRLTMLYSKVKIIEYFLFSTRSS